MKPNTAEIELLAPAGSFESMKGAFSAGADAVYIGGLRFGARAFADNLDEEQMLRAIDYAHIHKKKLYMTVNTLLKDAELGELYGYLLPYYREGLDAVIVQDLGVFRYIKEQFPDMDIHASTQMTVTGYESARMMKEEGASRVVTARELSLSEIHQIHEQVDIEIESFVHGALCFCYSGQCLLSSMIGGRSGNRGRCAQPCRLPYELSEQGRILSTEKNRYLCSPKDMCTLELIPEISEAGVYSFKIEGRMKKPEYTAGVTSVYRKYIDRYQEYGKELYHVDQEDILKLSDLYNRGGFSKGYYQVHNGREMMSMARPNHYGTSAAKVTAVTATVKLKALEALHEKDILELHTEAEQKQKYQYILRKDVKKNELFTLESVRGMNLNKNDCLYRTRNQQLIDELTEAFVKRSLKAKINGILILSTGESAILSVDDGEHYVTVTGETVQQAQKRPLSRADVEKQFRKTGQTEFEFDHLQIEMDDSIFMPMQSLNELRRKGIEALTASLLESCKRMNPDQILLPVPDTVDKVRREQTRMISISVETYDQLREAVCYEQIKRIYLSDLIFTDRAQAMQDSEKWISLCHDNGKECFYQSAGIERTEGNERLQYPIEFYSQFDGTLLRSLELLFYLKEHQYGKEIAADANLYTWNRKAREVLKEMGIRFDTLPYELKQQELQRRGAAESEMVIYGYYPLMISAQCFRKNTRGCDRSPSLMYLKDRKEIQFPVKNHCSRCMNVLYNSSPLELIDQRDIIDAVAPSFLRLAFTVESGKETASVIRDYIAAFCDGKQQSPCHKDFTRGHLKRGVE